MKKFLVVFFIALYGNGFSILSHVRADESIVFNKGYLRDISRAYPVIVKGRLMVSGGLFESGGVIVPAVSYFYIHDGKVVGGGWSRSMFQAIMSIEKGGDVLSESELVQLIDPMLIHCVSFDRHAVRIVTDALVERLEYEFGSNNPSSMSEENLRAAHSSLETIKKLSVRPFAKSSELNWKVVFYLLEYSKKTVSLFKVEVEGAQRDFGITRTSINQIECDIPGLTIVMPL